MLIKCNNKQLSFGDDERSLGVECASNWQAEITIGQLRKLFLHLSRIEEQPLTISFNNSHCWIEIYNLLI